MAEELVKEYVEKETGSWLDKLEKRLRLAQPPEETKYEQSDTEMAYEAPRNLVSGSEEDYGGVTVEPSLEKVVKKKAGEAAEWGKQGMSDLFVGETESGDLLKDKPSYMTDTLVRGFGGGFVGGLKNMGDFFGLKTIYEEGSKALDYVGLDHNVVFNLPGIQGYDPDRPMVFLSSSSNLKVIVIL